MATAVLVIAGLTFASSPQIAHAAAGALTGRITQSGGVSVSGATVQILVPGTTTEVASTSSDTDGIYSVVVDTGTYDVRFTGPVGSGLGTALLTNRTVSGVSTTLDVLLVAEQIAVSGRVVDGAGVGIANASVSLVLQTNQATNVSTQTNGTGSYSIPVSAGSYYLQVSRYQNNADPANMTNSTTTYIRAATNITASTTLDDVVFTNDTHTITILNADNTPATKYIQAGANIFPYQLQASFPMPGMPATPGLPELYGFTWNGPVHGTAIIPTLAQVTTAPLQVRDTQFSGITLVNTTLDLAHTNSTLILLTGAGGTVASGDNDGDNVADAIEALAPDTDVNDDGTPDFQQDNVTSLPILGASSGEYVTLAVRDDLTLTNVQTIPLDSIDVDPPEGARFPVGLVQFVVPSVPANSDVTVRISVTSTAGVTGYAKFNPTTQAWTELDPTRVNVQPGYVDIRITDNGIGDDDPVVGRISDPGAPIIGSFAPKDTTPPIITCPAAAPDVILHSAGTLTAQIADTESGTASPTSSAAVNTATVGPTIVAVTASDLAGNSATVSCPARVVYNAAWTSAASPTQFASISKASTITGAFRLLDANNIVVAGASHVRSFVQATITCPTAVGVGISTQNGNHDASIAVDGAGRWTFAVFYNGSTKNTCQSISVSLDDGTTKTISFRIV